MLKKPLLITAWVLFCLSSLNSYAQVVISQVYGGGGNSGAPYTHDYIELFNRGAVSVSLAGLSLQYASAAGTGNFGSNSGQLTELPNVTLQPGQYFLIQQAGAASGSALPSPDFTDATPINMSGTAGKVALVTGITSLGCNGGSAACNAEATARILDLVGYGTTANYFEGVAAPAPSNTTAIFRSNNGCTDTNNNSTDFTAAAPAPRNSGNSVNPCSSGTVISINNVQISEGNAGTTAIADFTVSLSAPAPGGGVTFDITTADGTATAGSDYTVQSLTGQSIPAGSTTYAFSVTINGDDVFEPNENFTVNVTNITGATPGNISATGTIQNDDAAPVTPIYTIQGSGLASPFVGQTVSTTGIVTGDYQGSTGLNGFYIQDASGDGDPATSDGIFVFSNTAVSAGQWVLVSGPVREAFNQTQIGNTGDNVSVTVQAGTPTAIAPVVVNLPVSVSTDLERYEGMQVQFTQTLTVTENFTLARFGEVLLSANPGYSFGGDGRLYNPTNFIDPTDIPASGVENNEDNKVAVTTQQTANDLSAILLDDASNIQNPAVVPYLSPENTLRLGSTVTNLTGVLGFGFGVYRLQPTVPPSFVYNARPLAPPSIGNANLKVGSFNVLNYFNGNGQGGGFPTSRGADTEEEFFRQQTKIVAALDSLDADIVGLIEIENDGDGENSAIQQLVAELNASTGAGTYDYIRDPANGGTGTDAIKVAFIYKPSVVTPVDMPFADLDPIHNRPPLAQIFRLNANGEKVTAIINHFKSKSGTGTGRNADQGDGQGNFNQDRIEQAEALLAFINSIVIPAAGDPDVIILGDLNAYNEEDPIDVLRAAGFINLYGPESYSYVFEGQSGSLDHALVSPSLLEQYTAGGKWHINADEPLALDYNQEFNPPYLYEENPFRSSDHDPVVVGLRLYTPLISFAEATKTVSEGVGTYTVNLSLSDVTYQSTTVSITVAANGASGDDFTTTPAALGNTISINIPAGSSTASFTLTIIDDQIDELAETITFTITSVSSGLKLGSQAASIITIEDNDLPVISFSQAEASIEEQSGMYMVTLLLSIPPVTDQTVTIHINDNEFVYGKNDYVTNPDGKQGSFTLPVPTGSTTVTFTVIPDKNAVKKKEAQNIEFSISQVSAGLATGTPDTFTLTIRDEKTDWLQTYFYLWPNPTQGFVRIVSDVKEPVEVVLRSSRGEVLFTGKGTVEEVSQQLSSLLPEQPRGLHILQVFYKGKTTILKVVKW